MANLKDKLNVLDLILTKNLMWISNADTKATILFGINSAMLGVLAALVPFPEQWTPLAIFFTSVTGLILVTSIIFLVSVAFPILKGPGNSLIYFGGIASYEQQKYVDRVLKGINHELLVDFAKQCYRNAEIAKIKYEFINKAVIFAVIALPFWLASIWFLYPLKFTTP